MAYATPDDYIAAVGAAEAEDHAPAVGGGIDTARLTARLDAASDEIDGYLGGRYVLPEGRARAVCVALARYRMAADAQPDGRVGKDYADATQYLRDVVAGKTALTPVASGTPVGGGAVLVSSRRAMTCDTLRDY
ncbi:phage protein Gp36 family protein [Pararhodospirillum oryzae]|uniref:DUF1320 domain-containing protein n=1 Tax=Pararhodospirillum oryzae TaxID=478448 RepID=A0A512H9Y5_9PROT|nr:phage protein Gp36 family protein [Pararhodospirillum oryzae]GEO82274.1 hypothetical protein ROR02_24050 [Pararhodospirillum oryzae]